jgi:copper chaperone CopZ
MKKWSLWVTAVVLAGTVGTLRAEEVKIKLEGVKCDTCASVLADAVKKVPGAKLKDAPSLTKTVVTVDVDLKKADLGDIAMAVAGAETPHKADEAPGANIVIAAPGLTDKNKKQVADALKKVKGVDADFSTGDVKAKEITVKLADKGGAKLDDIKKALAAFTK